MNYSIFRGIHFYISTKKKKKKNNAKQTVQINLHYLPFFKHFEIKSEITSNRCSCCLTYDTFRQLYLPWRLLAFHHHSPESGSKPAFWISLNCLHYALMHSVSSPWTTSKEFWENLDCVQTQLGSRYLEVLLYCQSIIDDIKAEVISLP